MIKKSRILIYPLAIMGISLLLTNSCQKKDDAGNPSLTEEVPTVTTNSVTNITQTTATAGGNVTSEGSSSVTVRGVCWSTSQSPTTSDNHTHDGTGTSSFSSNITGLIANTPYYVRAYALNSYGTGYGNEVSFTTLPGSGGTITDLDGNVYHTTTIGTQVWMVENLKTTKYRNGDPIPNVSDSVTWANLNTGAYCNYHNDANNSAIYGRLYNWYAIGDNRHIAPSGFHVPSDAEWTILTDFCGGLDSAGGKLKEKGSIHWQSPNTGATNESGFTAVPGGYRLANGEFYYMGSYGYWWSSSEYGPNYSWSRYMYYLDGKVGSQDDFQYCGFSVRCLRD
jgi:uncharacterized protein (TIGR02145 family)